jgi:hypothetical protein
MAEQAWLFRQGELVLGPVSSKQIVEKLYSGELTVEGEVQVLGSGVFRKLSDIQEFKVHVAKANAKQRVESHVALAAARGRTRTKQLLSGGAVLLVAAGIGVAFLGRYLAVHTPLSKTADELAWGDIEISAPTIGKAKRKDSDELVEYPGATKKPAPVALARNSGTGATPAAASPAAAAPASGKAKMDKADGDGLQVGEVDTGAIKPTLVACIRQIAKPGVVARIPIEFAIGETGKVSKVWVDNPDYKTGVLPECLLRELQKWPFKASASGGATVQLSFNIGKKG